jgi:hypothetical protein
MSGPGLIPPAASAPRRSILHRTSNNRTADPRSTSRPSHPSRLPGCLRRRTSDLAKKYSAFARFQRRPDGAPYQMLPASWDARCVCGAHRERPRRDALRVPARHMPSPIGRASTVPPPLGGPRSAIAKPPVDQSHLEGIVWPRIRPDLVRTYGRGSDRLVAHRARLHGPPACPPRPARLRPPACSDNGVLTTRFCSARGDLANPRQSISRRESLVSGRDHRSRRCPGFVGVPVMAPNPSAANLEGEAPSFAAANRFTGFQGLLSALI